MKIVKNFLDKHKPKFEKGGKFSWLHSTFDALETFAFVPNRVTREGAHIRDAIDMKRAMIMVVIALIPCFLFGTYNIGFQHFRAIDPSLGFFDNFGDNLIYGLLKILPLYVISYGVGLIIEFIFAQKRGHEVNEGYLVSGMLIPLIVPPDIPLWQLAIAVIFAVIIGKEAFGGTGMNFMNPALIARAFLFFAYPSNMSGDNVWISDKLDAYSGATPLADMMSGNILPNASLCDMIIGWIPGSIGETSAIAIGLGAIILIVSGIASWRIMLSTLIGGATMGLIFNFFGSAATPYTQIPFYYHYVMGGFLFGTVFMATDPVTASQTNKGKWIYGFLIGLMAVLIRVVNPAYPEGMMLAILLLNVFAPFIDYCVVGANIKSRVKRGLKKKQ